jgi:hypothetical protein
MRQKEEDHLGLQKYAIRCCSVRHIAERLDHLGTEASSSLEKRKKR